MSASRVNIVEAALLPRSVLRSAARRPTAALSPCSVPALLLAASYRVCAASSLLRSL
jgi:hypothetical protein